MVVGKACPAAAVCQSGACEVVCQDGSAPCADGSCDLTADPNCGSCDNDCSGQGLTCQDSACVASDACPGEVTCCDGSCDPDGSGCPTCLRAPVFQQRARLHRAAVHARRDSCPGALKAKAARLSQAAKRKHAHAAPKQSRRE